MRLAMLRRMAIIVVIVVGVAMRAWFVALGLDLSGDGTLRYEPLARSLVSAGRFARGSSPECLQVPGYPLFLAVLYQLTHSSHEAVAVVQLGIEIAILAAAFDLARREWGRRVADVVLFVGWLSPVFAHYARLAHPALLTGAATITLCYLILRARRSQLRSHIWWMLAGVTAGIAVLIRVDMYPFVIAMPVVAVSLSPRDRRALWSLMSYTALLVMPLTLWGLRQYVVCGTLEIPGWRQFLPVGHSYVRWVDSWLDDPRLVEQYGYRALDPTASPELPPSVLDADEQALGTDALREAKRAGSLTIPTVGAKFDQLAEAGARRRSISRRCWIRARRTALTWIRAPSLLPEQLPGVFRVLAYAVWGAILLFACIGSFVGVLRLERAVLLLLIIVLGRTAMPLVSAWGAVVPYVAPAFVPVYILAARGLLMRAAGRDRPAQKTNPAHE